MEATMAAKITVILEDDLEGGPADETVRFGIGGTDYEIDLSTQNAAAFRRQLTPYIEHARRASEGQRQRPRRAAASRARSTAIRAWAKQQGIVLSDRGRIPADVAERHQSAALPAEQARPPGTTSDDGPY
jgi:hypothetical protein